MIIVKITYLEVSKLRKISQVSRLNRVNISVSGRDKMQQYFYSANCDEQHVYLLTLVAVKSFSPQSEIML